MFFLLCLSALQYKSTTNVCHQEVTFIYLNTPLETLGEMTNTLTHLMSLYCTERQQSQPYVHHGPRLWLSESEIHMCKQGNGRFATDLQGRLQTSDGDPRIGTFPQTQVIVGDTTCRCARCIRTVNSNIALLIFSCSQIILDASKIIVVFDTVVVLHL